jgi:hypothetical protein
MRTEILWAVHNLIAHPASEICHWLGYVYPEARYFGSWLHDATEPAHEAGKGRG